MKKRKVLISGANGLLGGYLSREFFQNSNYETYGLIRDLNNLQYVSIPCICVDLLDFKKISDIFLSLKPDIFFHLGGVTKVDEANKLGFDKVYKVNVESVKFIASLCEKINCKFIYFSTDLVYDGTLGGNCDENFKVNPASIYAKSKLLAEESVKSISSNFLILRCALMYGLSITNKTNHYQDTVIKLLKNEKAKLFVDQFRSPIWFEDCAKIAILLSESELRNEVINLGGQEKVSRYQLIEYIAKKLNKENLLEKAYSKENEELATVADVSLNVSKMLSLGAYPTSIEIVSQVIYNHLINNKLNNII